MYPGKTAAKDPARAAIVMAGTGETITGASLVNAGTSSNRSG
mgnify:CR=1 FL=1